MDFLGGGDRVLYDIDLGEAQGPFTITVELLYQSIAYRWAHNLKQKNAAEIERFVSYYESMSQESAVVLARTEGTVR